MGTPVARVDAACNSVGLTSARGIIAGEITQPAFRCAADRWQIAGMVRLENIGLRYGSEPDGADALAGISLAVPHGGFAWVTGPAGAGKSTLMQILGLQKPPTRGRMTMLGADPWALERAGRTALRRRIGVIAAAPRLIAGMTLFDSVALSLRLAGSSVTIEADVMELITWLGLAGKARDDVAGLSAGERHLVEAARAIALQPDVLVADEPTGNLDGERAEQVMRLLWELHAIGSTMLVATADAGWCDWQPAPIIRLAAGRRVNDG